MNLAMEPVRMSVKDEIVHIELNRPERLNAMNVEMVDCLIERLEEIIKSEKKVVILSGAGTGFSSGGDIQSMSAGISDPLFKEIMGKVNEMILKVFTLPQIVISAVHGPAVGLGFSLALVFGLHRCIPTSEFRIELHQGRSRSGWWMPLSTKEENRLSTSEARDLARKDFQRFRIKGARNY